MPPHTILIFESDNEEQQYTLRLMCSAVDMQRALSEILDPIFRDHLKYNKQQLNNKQLEAIGIVHDQIIEKLEENDVLKLL